MTDENWYKRSLPEAAKPSAPQVPIAPERVVFTARDWLALGMGLICALLWFASFSFGALMGKYLPALGAAAFTLALWASVLIYLGRGAKWNRWNAGLAVGVGLLTLCCCIYANEAVRLINFLLIACGSALCFFSLSGVSRYALTEARVVWESAANAVASLFSNVFKPFRALSALGEGGKKTARQTLVGLAVGLPLLIIVIALLSSADAVFGSIFTGIAHWLERMDAGRLIWRVLRTAAFSLLIFSALYYLRHNKTVCKEAATRKPAPASPFILVLALLSVVYIIFVVIQFRFLFGGASTAAMEGGYAEYARNGFFQLVWVSAINLCAVLICAVGAERSRAVNIMSTLVLALTAVILFSAFWRMRLYILSYGMTLLRAETLWAMAFIAVCLLLALARVWKGGFRFWPVFAAVGLAGWVLFNAVNIDARIADYNVDAYLSGKLESVDIYYLSRLSPDTLPALERLRQERGGNFAGAGESEFYLSCDLDDAIEYIVEHSDQTERWQSWCYSAARVK